MDGYTGRSYPPPLPDYFGFNPRIVPQSQATTPGITPNAVPGPAQGPSQGPPPGGGNEWLYPLPTLDPVEQMEREMMDMVVPLAPGPIDHAPSQPQSAAPIQPAAPPHPSQTPITGWKPASSIPPDLSSANYAAQCIAAAESSRMPPFKLAPGEYNVLRQKLSQRHVTTYLNIRNGILRLWLANPTVAVTMTEAAGCVRNERYYPLAEFAFEWLTRNGYINHGCFPRGSVLSLPFRGSKPRQTIVVVGAGIAGLSAARQVEALVARYPHHFAEYEDLPRVVVLEGRRRIGGRIYTPRLSTTNAKVDLGADTVLGFGNGNPLGVLMRRQLGIPVMALESPGSDPLYDGATGDPLPESADYRAHRLFNHLLDRMRAFESVMVDPPGAAGDKTLIRAGRDPSPSPEDVPTETIAHVEQRTRPYTTPAPVDEADDTVDSGVEVAYLREIGFSTTPAASRRDRIDIHAEPAGGVGTGSLGLTMRGFVDQLAHLAELDDMDIAALDWYYAKFEFYTGDNVAKQGLSSWSHHRRNRFSGRHAWARDGFSALARGLDTVPTKLDVRFNTPVTVIEYEDDSVTVGLENGDQINADRVIVTVPLGVLKKRSLQFIPDLPQWKTDSIGRLAFGVVNKVCLVFDQLFWDPDAGPLIRATTPKDHLRGECFMFQNMARKCGASHAVMIGLVSGEAAQTLPQRSDREIVDDAVARLRRIFRAHPAAQSARLVESIVTRWQLDPFARGAFSHVGTEGTVVDHDLLSRPVGNTLFFAGEATSRLYPGTIHGAYLSGLRSAKEVINSMLGPLEVPDLSGSNGSGNGSSLLTPSGASAAHVVPPPTVPRGEGSVSTTPSELPRRDATQSVTPQVPMWAPPGAVGAVPSPMGRSLPPPSADIEDVDSELMDLRRRRLAAESEQMERELVNQLGEKPERPERIGTTNPFLLFQKDYWGVCRVETENAKQQDRKGGHATRNEIRVTLGKKWRSLPINEKQPYIDRSQRAKDSNEQKHDEYVRQLRFYEAEADNFRQQWQQDHPSVPSARERFLEQRLDELRPRRKRIRIRE